MKRRRQHSRRKAPRIDARWLVAGKATPAILHHGQRAYLIPVQGGHHPSRYKPDQRLALKTYIPGPTEGHVILTDVHGLTERFRIRDVTDTIARELGYDSLEHFQASWVVANDEAWIDAQGFAHGAHPAVFERFEERWSLKLAWLLRFRLDHAAAPRMLASAPSVYDPLKEDAEGRDEDRGYTTSDSRSFKDEMPALTDDEWRTHIGPESRYREFERLRTQKAERETGTLEQRLQSAQRVAKTKGYDIRDEVKVCEAYLRKCMTEKAKRQLALIESRVFPVAA